jgi:recombination protein RecT
MSNKNNQLAMVKKDTVDVVAEKVKQFQESGELHFPASYSPENAMKSAWLILQNAKDKDKRPVLDVCTKDSIANSLLEMVVQGLNPMKKQGYFIAYGNQLTFQRSYFGTMAVTKLVTGARDIDAAVIYEGDDVDYEMKNGRIVNLTHKQKFQNIDKEKILGAYATIVFSDDRVYHELMTIDEIRKAWSKAQFWAKDRKVEKEGSTHDEFKQEMAKKTVINRACKKFLNSSNDASLTLDYFNRSDESNDEAQLKAEIQENANQEVIDIDYELKDDTSSQTEPSKQEDPEMVEQQEETTTEPPQEFNYSEADPY